MAFYDYLCPQCGPFTDLRPMDQSGEPGDCPGCGTLSPRAFLSMPSLSGLSSPRLQAHERNERSAHEPKIAHKHVCGSGCGHGQQKPVTKAYKSFPGARPWALSH